MSKIVIYISYYINYSKYPVETVEINKIKRGPANSNGFKVRQLDGDDDDEVGVVKGFDNCN